MKRSWAVLVSLAFVACSQQGPSNESSSDHAPSDLGIFVAIASNGADVTASVRMNVKGVPCDLTGGDRLVLRAADGAERAFEAAGGTFSEYAAQIASTSTSVSLVFERGSETHAAAFDLPPAFVVVPPASLSRASPLQLTWTADPASSALVEASGPCIGPRFSRSFAADPGSFALQPADFTPGGECTLVVVVSRSRTPAIAGDLDLGFDTAGVKQIRTVVLETTP